MPESSGAYIAITGCCFSIGAGATFGGWQFYVVGHPDVFLPVAIVLGGFVGFCLAPLAVWSFFRAGFVVPCTCSIATPIVVSGLSFVLGAPATSSIYLILAYALGLLAAGLVAREYPVHLSPRCAHCGYSLVRPIPSICPECGQPVVGEPVAQVQYRIGLRREGPLAIAILVLVIACGVGGWIVLSSAGATP